MVHDRLTSVFGSIGKMQIFISGRDVIWPSWPGSSGKSQSVDINEMFNWKWESPWQMFKFLHKNSQTLWLHAPLRQVCCHHVLSPSLRLAITIPLWQLAPLHYFLSLFPFDKLPSLRFAFTVCRNLEDSLETVFSRVVCVPVEVQRPYFQAGV